MKYTQLAQFNIVCATIDCKPHMNATQAQMIVRKSLKSHIKREPSTSVDCASGAIRHF